MLKHLVNGGDALFDGARCAAFFLDGASPQGAGRTVENAVTREINERFDLIRFASETEEEDGSEVGVGGVADEDPAEEVGGFAVFGHAAPGAVGDGDDAVDVRVGAEDLRGEVGGNAAGYGGRAVYRGEDTDIVAGADPVVGPHDALKGCGCVDERCTARFRADGVIALEVAGDQVMTVDELAWSDGLGRETDDLVELTDGLAGSNGVDREFVACGDIGARGQMQTIKGLACNNWLEGDHHVVRASEFECVVAQTILLSPINRR